MTDENGTVHTLARSLGFGSQGEVWLTANHRRVVKVLKPTASQEHLRRQIAFVKHADLSGLFVARPLALLRPPHCGYVAEFLTDMVPIRSLLAPPRGQSVSAWYVGAGGLRRRLRLLAHTAEAMAGLHARGLIYGDVSHTNVFISEPTNAHEAWLIDLDNLRYDSDPHRRVWTDWYGAPEVVTGREGNTTFSDAWSFAVLAFEVLTLALPFRGDIVDDDPDLEEDAKEGRLPWIEDRADDRNRSSTGLPRSSVLSSKLMETAQATFGGGRVDRTARPSMATWAERLHSAADRTVRCAVCPATYYETLPACPWCETTRPTFGFVRLERWAPGHGRDPVLLARMPLTQEVLSLTRRVTHAETGVASRQAMVTLEAADHGAILRAAPGGRCWITDAADRKGESPREVTERGVTLPVSALERSFVIHFDAIDVPHRVARIGGVQ